jgi:hypothetical protein
MFLRECVGSICLRDRSDHIGKACRRIAIGDLDEPVIAVGSQLQFASYFSTVRLGLAATKFKTPPSVGPVLNGR